MSCVTSTIESREPLLQVAQHVEDLALHDDVERRHRLVGQQQAGFQRQRHGDGGALAHAAGELVRIVGEPAFAQAHQVEQFGRAGAGGGARFVAALGQHLDELGADGVDRIERAHGALRHIGDVAPQQLPGGLLVDRLALEDDTSAGAPAVLGQHAHDGAHRRGLAAARFAHQADDAALGDGERRAVDRPHRAGPRAVMDLQAVDLEDHRPTVIAHAASA